MRLGFLLFYQCIFTYSRSRGILHKVLPDDLDVLVHGPLPLVARDGRISCKGHVDCSESRGMDVLSLIPVLCLITSFETWMGSVVVPAAIISSPLQTDRATLLQTIL
jgi:hypothetical protein